MSYRVFDLEVRWDGTKLIARRQFGDGFRLLTGTDGPEPRALSTACTQKEDLTAFELGVFTANASRVLVDMWEYEQEPMFMFDQVPRARQQGG